MSSRDSPGQPKWLRIPYIKPCKGINSHINPETNFNNSIQTGAGLWKRGDDFLGIDLSIDSFTYLFVTKKFRTPFCIRKSKDFFQR